MPERPLLVVQPADDDPIGRLGDWLIEAGVDLDVRNAEVGDAVPHDLRAHCGLIVLGGGVGAADDTAAPWLPSIRALLRRAVEQEIPTLGVCLGAQLLTLACGGQVAPNPDGPEFGAQLVAKRSSAAGDPLFGALPITPDVIQWHFDAVTRLPAGAVLLAGSPLCDVQAFRLGRLAWAVQFHIETTPDVVRAWAAADADALDGYDVDSMLRRVEQADADIVEVWQPFAAAFADVLRAPDSVTAHRGPVLSTAEPITDPAAIRAALAAELTASRAPHLLPAPRVRRRDPE
ncbi:MAG TPA: type 1 glutamine amidotransferase [Jatrophihabitantaceae bacterium]|jgi:GMP synthase-like glutamine amidotransferase|nr:type 1 glutamine amidotransferase [Jatrophihabitantaceae bacterium]